MNMCILFFQVHVHFAVQLHDFIRYSLYLWGVIETI